MYHRNMKEEKESNRKKIIQNSFFFSFGTVAKRKKLEINIKKGVPSHYESIHLYNFIHIFFSVLLFSIQPIKIKDLLFFFFSFSLPPNNLKIIYFHYFSSFLLFLFRYQTNHNSLCCSREDVQTLKIMFV